MDFVRKEKYGIGDLLHIVKLLRAPDGCPWDREQTHESIRKNLIEETYEVADAIDQQDSGLLKEELGDLLLQIALHTEMEDEAGRFTFEDVCDGISKKLISRHPHVFGDEKVDGSAQVLRNWEAIKNEEKGRVTAANRLDSVPASLPALMRAEKIQKRAADFGFKYPGVNFVLADLTSEVAELQLAFATGEDLLHEVGDVLFSAANAARFAGVDAEEALSQSSNRFAERVKRCEELAAQEGKELAGLDEKEMDRLWKLAKQQLRQAKS